jgi:phage repressor protein C with HTH and peptisase S24 domain
MEPVYRDGDTVIVSPGANLRRGDRVVVKTNEGEVMAKQLARRGAKKVELLSLNAAHGERTINVEEISFIHRIIWASQ